MMSEPLPCGVVKGIDHRYIPVGSIKCHACDYRSPPFVPSSLSSSQAPSASESVTSTSSTTTPAVSHTGSLFLPTKPRNPGPSITAARAGLTHAIQKQAAKDSARARPTTPVQKDVQFRVQICQHKASDGWDWEEDCLTLGVAPGMGYTLPGFIEYLVGEAQLTTTQVLTHLHPAVTPTGPGEWSLAVNHLTPTNKKPRYFRLWSEITTVDKILRIQQYNRPINGAFNCSLIWKVLEAADIPEDDISIENGADGDSDVYSINTLATDDTFLKKLGTPGPIPPPEDPAVKMARLLADHKADVEESAKLVEIRARYDALLKEMDLYEEQDRACHKRKISAAIPANERPNADGDVVATGEADEADEADEANGMIVAAARGNESQAGGDEGVSARGGNVLAVRRSSRQREADEANGMIVDAARGNGSQAGGDEGVSARGGNVLAIRRSSRQRRPKQLD
jgi:hypothetical protein